MMLLFLVVSCTLLLLAKLGYSKLYLPWRIQSHFHRQGISGPGYRPVLGNTRQVQQLRVIATSKPLLSITHSIIHRVVPFFAEWSEQYGGTFLYWFGSTPRLAISDPDMIKAVLTNPSGAFEKVRFNPQAGLLFGDGLAKLQGEKWARHRRIANQAFLLLRVKEWVPRIVVCATNMLKKWEHMRVESGKEELDIDIVKHLHQLSADIISRTAFGSSYQEGRRIFALQDEQQYLFSHAVRSIYIPGFRFVPTKKNRQRWRIEKEIQESIRRLNCNNTRLEEEDSKNLITLLTASYQNQQGIDERMMEEEIIEECKTFYFTGKDTTATLLSWALLLLANHQEWQSKAREEVIRVCGEKEAPVAENITSLKVINMIINETLRLYPPTVMILREATKAVKLGNLNVPAGTQILLSTIAAHHDAEYWGKDAEEFNPERFSKPRKHLASLIPFGLGQRNCVGSNLALIEAKVSLAMVVREYFLEVSPTYVHAPVLVVVMQPQYGVQLILKRRN